MNNKKAIEILKHCGAEEYCIDYKQGHCEGCNQRIAQDMAIEVLKTEAIPIEWILDYKDKYTVITSEECDPVKAEVIVDMLAEWAERKEE